MTASSEYCLLAHPSILLMRKDFPEPADPIRAILSPLQNASNVFLNCIHLDKNKDRLIPILNADCSVRRKIEPVVEAGVEVMGNECNYLGRIVAVVEAGVEDNHRGRNRRRAYAELATRVPSSPKSRCCYSGPTREASMFWREMSCPKSHHALHMSN